MLGSFVGSYVVCLSRPPHSLDRLLAQRAHLTWTHGPAQLRRPLSNPTSSAPPRPAAVFPTGSSSPSAAAVFTTRHEELGTISRFLEDPSRRPPFPVPARCRVPLLRDFRLPPNLSCEHERRPCSSTADAPPRTPNEEEGRTCSSSRRIPPPVGGRWKGIAGQRIPTSKLRPYCSSPPRCDLTRPPASTPLHVASRGGLPSSMPSRHPPPLLAI